MANVGALRTTISLDSAQFEQGMAGVNRQLQSLKNEQKAVTSSGTGFARGLTEMRDKSDVLGRTLDLQREKVQQLKRRYDEAKDSTGENSKATQDAQVEYNKAVAEMNKTENQLKNLTAEIERQSNPWNRLSEGMENAGKKLQDVGKGMTDFGKSYSMRVTAPILGLAGAALKVGMDFEQGMSKVQAISGATGDDLTALSDQAKELGETTRFSATEAASGMEFLAMAGFETNEILSAMPGLLDLAASSNMDLGRAADIASNIISGFGYAAEDSGRVADVLAKGASSANTNVAQLGDAMATVAPVASALGLDVEGLTAAVGFMSDAGIQGSQAGRMLRQGLLRLADPTGAAGDLIEELGINVFDADGNMKELHDVVGELENGLDGMSAQAQTAALSTIFGAQSVAGWTALIDRGGDELGDYTGSLEDAEGAASEMAATMSDNAKGKIVEFQSALEGIGIALSEHMIPVVTDAVEWGTELVRKFGELDEETQKNILQIGLFAAAIGPAAIVAGNLTTAVGGILTAGGKVAGMLGAAGGTGLVGKIGLLGAGSALPVGLAIAGVGALAGGAYYLYQNMNQLHDISTETADAMMDQYQANIPLIDSFDELREKSEWTNKEFGDYLDLQTRLKNETDPEAIIAIHQEMQNLQKESGLSNQELEDMIRHNNDIVEAIPEATSEITDQGNRIADTTNNLKEYNQEIANMARRELESELQKALANEIELREQIKEAQVELNGLEEHEAGLREVLKAHADGNLDTLKEKLLAEKDIVEEAIREGAMRGEVSQELYNQEESIDKLLALADMDIDKAREALGIAIDKVDEQHELIRGKEAELDKTGELVAKMVEYELIAAGVNEETAKKAVKDAEVSGLLDDQVESLEDQKKKLEKNTSEADKLGEEYKIQVNEIEKQIGKLNDARGNIEDLIDEAGKYNKELAADINKNVNVNTYPTLGEFNSQWSSPLTRLINFRANTMNLPNVASNADGTDFHPGGLSWLGEEGPELIKKGNNWAMADFGLYDLPRGYQVFTHDESKKIMRALNNVPAYANGTNMGAETNRVVGQLNNQNQTVDNTETISLLTRIAVAIESGQSIQIDGKEMMRATVRHYDEGLNNIGDRKAAAWGG